jgi:hypothetical protein
LASFTHEVGWLVGHAFVEAGQPHAPPSQTPLLKQTSPQPPQFPGSSVVFTHSVGAAAGQAVEFAPPQAQTPPVQSSLAKVHACPHAPQFFASPPRSTHCGAPPQSCTVAGLAAQTQTPSLQVPRPQSCPQAPQFFASCCSAVQAEPQIVSPAGHSHAPPAQLPPATQAFAHAPQWNGSRCSETQTPPQWI